MIRLLDDLKLPRLRAVLKCLLYWTIFLVLLFLSGSQLTNILSADWYKFVYGTLGTISALLATYLILKIEGKSFSEYGLAWDKETLFKFIKGLFWGTIIFMAIILVLVLFTDIHIKENFNDWNPLTIFWLLSIIPLALMEEIAFRAYPFLKLNNAFGLRITQLLVAITFALYHILQGWNFQVAFLGPGIWAFVFGLAAIKSNGIALPTGIHVSLNLIQTLIGMKGDKSESIWILQHSESASTESIAHSETIGLVTQILVLVGAVLLTELYVRNKKIVDK